MSEVIVIATFTARPGAAAEVEAALAAALAPTHAEDGCLLYALHAGISDPDTYVFVERWSSDTALAAHARQPWVTGLSEIGGLLTAPPRVEIFRALGGGDPAVGLL
jgi:quinol monooxygenase YgiN